MGKKELLSIKDFATLCRTTVRTIRFYDQSGLIKPSYVDPFTKYRYYSQSQVRNYFRIKLFHTFDFPLKVIGRSLKSKDKQGLLDQKLTDLEKQIEENQREYKFLNTIRQFLFGETNAESFLKGKIVGPYFLFCKYVEKGKYDAINNYIFDLLDLAQKLKIPVTDKQILFYLDPLPYKPKNTRLEICLICKTGKEPRVKLPPDHYFKSYPKSKVCLFNYQGPFEYIALVYQKFHEKRQNRILKPNEVGFDIYSRGPWNEKSEYNYLTQICFPTD